MTTDHSSSRVDLEYLRKTVEMVGYLQKTHCEQLFSEIQRLQADLEHTRQIVGAQQKVITAAQHIALRTGLRTHDKLRQALAQYNARLDAADVLAGSKE